MKGILRRASICIAIWFSVSISMLAQYPIRGIVIDKSNSRPLTDANVLLMPSNQGAVTDAKGHFGFDNVAEGNYQMIVSMMGYQTYKQSVTVNSKEMKTLTILLSADSKSITEVDVVGEGAEQRLLNKPNMEPVSLETSATKISRIDLVQKGAVTLIDGMKYVPGGLTETRGRKVKQFFSVRGQTYPYPTYSVDGIWQKEFQETAYFLNAANIESIEIVRSGSAILKSLSPLSGVIDVTSRRYQQQETSVIAKYGSRNTFQTGVTHGNSTEKLHYSAGAQLFGTDGPEGRNGQERIINVDGNLDWKINDQLEAGFKLFYLGGSRQLVQPIGPADNKFRNRKEKYDPLNTIMVSSRLAYTPSDRLSSELQINFAHRDPQYQNENLSSGDMTKYKETDYEVTINQLNALKLSSTNVLRLGVLYNHWVAPEGKRYYYGNKSDVHTLSGVIADQQRMGKWLLDAGFRLTQEYYKEWGGFGIEGSGGKFKKVLPIKDEWQSPVWQVTTGVTYSANALLSWHANGAAGIVTPRKGALNEAGEQPGNEKRTNIDLGFSKKFNNAGQIKLTAFMVNRKEAIEFSGSTLELDNGDIIELYTNVDKRYYGVELDARMPLIGSWLTGFTNATLMKGETKDATDWKRDDEIPEFIANAGINVVKSKFDGNLYVNYTGAFKNDRFVSKSYLQEFGKAPLGDFYSVDLTAGYTWGKKDNMRFFTEVNNLFDEAFQTVPGYPDFGRMVSVGVNVKL